MRPIPAVFGIPGFRRPGDRVHFFMRGERLFTATSEPEYKIFLATVYDICAGDDPDDASDDYQDQEAPSDTTGFFVAG
jgi:hypothetical protein